MKYFSINRWNLTGGIGVHRYQTEDLLMGYGAAKIHLIPIATGVKYALCASKIREGGRLAVHTRKEFNALPKDARCGRCDVIVNGKVLRS